MPSLGALAAFEAAARLGGFTKAANELGVTQAAVSRQIRALEADFGVPLFTRNTRQVVLTDAGRTLSGAVSDAFQTMTDAIEVLRAPREPTSLTVSTSLSFSHFWLLPRLPAFRSAYPLLQLRVISQDQPLDLRTGDADVAVRYGVAPFDDGEALAALPEEAFPVASPEFAARHDCDSISVEALAKLPLIEGHKPESLWLTWPTWFARAGLTRPPGRQMLMFNHYSDAVYAAMTGEGVVLGWNRLLERPLGDGRLVRLGTASVIPQEAHHVVVAGNEHKPAAMAFARWMVEKFTAPDAAPPAD
ncbi:LysR substrate-binding domain-containing protein [Acuticoccus sp. MNP-M23]|uniref:LysR substrate-binding domain-containing protein n=1 Tax=Acuticoccus sp. MNP-M23 TaxID=3072793 RepID=UPI0028156808|nr:LysR substrate-binding domain-containing protein [Acuticoccus sp. MNP-M23]WMS44491.1 LysR substrate-binding domain-containing protein [Acuticoccus sp. MNP-M23]